MHVTYCVLCIVCTVMCCSVLLCNWCVMCNRYKYVILIGQGRDMHIVCRKGFCLAYSVSTWYLDDIISRLKNKEIVCLTNINPATAIEASQMTTDCIKGFALDYGVHLTPQQVGAARLPQTEKSMLCSSWMSYYFSLVGDQVPNADHEIHLEPIPKKEVYKEYLHDMQLREEEYLSENSFVKLWKDVFPYVKVRKYKSSCGHCNLCTLLGEKRRQFRDRAGREEVTTLFTIHRTSTMGERRTYYNRRLEASLNSHLYLSTIADGMQQNHCTLPWFGNTKNPGCHIKQHLQGVLMHGHNMTVYRTFANVGGGGNLAIHTWLLSLEAYYRIHSRLPPILYHQIDGGSENCNATFLAIACLLVACRLVDKVVLTRLPVGHTHEDIDGLFALIWRKLRDEFVYTPSDFVKLIKIALKKKVNVEVIDLIALPDYTKLMKDCIDPNLGHWAKNEWSQLQIIIEKVEVSNQTPLGVKTTYRAYVEDEYVEIVQDIGTTNAHRSVCGLIPQLCKVRTHPLPGEPHLNWLHKIPDGDIEPAPFITGSHDAMAGVARTMSKAYSKDKPTVSAEWDKWMAEVAPQSDDVQQYRPACGGVVTQPGSFNYSTEDGELYIPFKNKLFGHTGFDHAAEVNSRFRGARVSTQGGLNMRVVESTSCVIHSGNKSAAAKQVGARNVLLEPDGTVPHSPYGVLNSAYPGRAEKRGKQTKKTNKSLGKTTIAKQTTAQRRKATIEADAGSSRDSDSDTDTNTASDSDTNTDSDSKSDSASTSTSAYIGN